MSPGCWNLLRRLRALITREDGQDMVEYALLITLIAAGATASMGKLATGVSAIFSNIETVISTNIT
jgi:pilus assembly protein Flp/PilA